MNREEYAKSINWIGTASREIQINDMPNFEIGQIINPGLSWTDGGEFVVETYGEYSIIFEISEELEGHAVDYDNEKECEDLSCEDCFREKEILINRDFEVVNFYEWDEEVQFAKVILKAVK